MKCTLSASGAAPGEYTQRWDKQTDRTDTRQTDGRTDGRTPDDQYLTIIAMAEARVKKST